MLLVPGLTATFLHTGAVKIKFQGSGKVTARPQGVNAKKTDCRHFLGWLRYTSWSKRAQSEVV